jgi:hypothetical protein
MGIAGEHAGVYGEGPARDCTSGSVKGRGGGGGGGGVWWWGGGAGRGGDVRAGRGPRAREARALLAGGRGQSAAARPIGRDAEARPSYRAPIGRPQATPTLAWPAPSRPSPPPCP